MVIQLALSPNERCVQFRQEIEGASVYASELKDEKDSSAFELNRRPVTNTGVCCGTRADRGPGWARESANCTGPQTEDDSSPDLNISHTLNDLVTDDRE